MEADTGEENIMHNNLQSAIVEEEGVLAEYFFSNKEDHVVPSLKKIIAKWSVRATDRQINNYLRSNERV